MQKIITEGKAKINAFIEDKVSKELPVFYNPMMEFNRTSSVFLLNALGLKDMNIALPLAGSGVRGIRFLLELDNGIIEKIHFNDYSKIAVENIRDNLILNCIIRDKEELASSKRIFVTEKDANMFLLESTGFDYIDIDPFGTPNPFLDSAMKRISRRGILAVTATDTSALAGSHPKACRRKYWANPMRNEMMHEFGLRILIRKVQLVAAQFDKALLPILSFSKDHYMRVYFSCRKSKVAVDDILKLHKTFDGYGPIWTSNLCNTQLLEKLKAKDIFYNTLYEESKIHVVGFFSLPALCSEIKHNPIPKKEFLIGKIRSSRFLVSDTHFDMQSIKTDMPKDKLISLIKSLS